MLECVLEAQEYLKPRRAAKIAKDTIEVKSSSEAIKKKAPKPRAKPAPKPKQPAKKRNTTK